MASSLKSLFGVKSNHNTHINGDVLNETEDPYALMNEFKSLYSEKLKAIDDNCEEPTEAKIRTLQDWVNDLTEQNLVLIKTVEDLEKEALNRINAFNTLATEAKELAHNDEEREVAILDLRILEEKISALQRVIEENNKSLDSCMKEIDVLSNQLSEKNDECELLRSQNRRLEELRRGVGILEDELQPNVEPFLLIIRKNKLILQEIISDAERLQELQLQREIVQNELKKNTEELKFKLEKDPKLEKDLESLSQRLQGVDSEMQHIYFDIKKRIEYLSLPKIEEIKELVGLPEQDKERLERLEYECRTLLNELQALSVTLQSSERRSRSGVVQEIITASQRFKELQEEIEALLRKVRKKQDSSEEKLHTNADLEQRLKQLQEEAKKIQENLKIKIAVLQSPQEKSETLLKETADAAKRLQDLRAEIEVVKNEMRSNSDDVQSLLQRVKRTVVGHNNTSERLSNLKKEVIKVRNDLNTKMSVSSSSQDQDKTNVDDIAEGVQRLQDLQDEIMALQFAPKTQVPTIIVHPPYNDGISQSFENLRSEAEKTEEEVKAKLEILRTPEGKKNEELVRESALAVLKLLDLNDALENEPLDEFSRGSLYDPTSGRLRQKKIQNEIEKTVNDLQSKSEVLQTPEGLNSEKLVFETAVAALRLQELQDAQSSPLEPPGSLHNKGNFERLSNLRRKTISTQNDLKAKMEILQSSEGTTNEQIIHDAALDTLKLFDLQDEAKSIQRQFYFPEILEYDTPHTQRLEELKTEFKKSYDNLKVKTNSFYFPENRKDEKSVRESGIAAIRLQDLQDEIEILENDAVKKIDFDLVPVGRAKKSMFDAIDDVQRHDELKKEIRKTRSLVNTEPILPGGRKSEKSVHEAAVAAIKLQDLGEEIESIENNLRRKSKDILDLLDSADLSKDPTGSRQRLEELKIQIKNARYDLKAKTTALRTATDDETKNTLVFGAAAAALRLQNLEEEMENLQRELKLTSFSLTTKLPEKVGNSLDGTLSLPQRLAELRIEVQKALNDLMAKTEALRPSNGRNEHLVQETIDALQRLVGLQDEVWTIIDELLYQGEYGNSVREKRVSARRSSAMMSQIKQMQNDIKEKENLVNREKSFRQEENNKIKDLEKRLETAEAELRIKNDYLLQEKKQNELLQDQVNKMKPSGDNNFVQKKISDLEKQLREKKSELADLRKENQRKGSQVHKQESRLEALKRELDEVLANSLKTDELLQKSLLREDSFKAEIFKLQKELEYYQKRINKQDETIQNLEQQLQTLQSNSSFEDPSRSQDFNEQIHSLLSAIKCKDAEIQRHIEHEKQLCFQITKMEHCVKDRDKQMTQMSETLKHLSAELQTRNAQLAKMEEEDAQRARQTIHDILENRKIVCTGSNFKEQDTEIIKLKSKLKDMQEALTAEIADKHDEIRRLKDDIKELEDKLLQSDKQTQYKDVIIKELRKEVKMGRAKESLAEMLGLKGTPRATMKNRLENLNGQMDEMRTHILSLETRLAECNLPAVLSLRSRLSNAEGSLLAMCNKMDYVRRYLENLKGNEELSMKCGLEALLNELRDDVEWNRQTRRNLSLDEGTSVIVISHRSRSLPDNSLHRPPVKTQSESAVSLATNKQLATTSHTLNTYEENKNYLHTINDLENDFDETDNAVLNTWNSFRHWSQNSSDSILKEFDNVVKLCVESNNALSKLASHLGESLDNKDIQDYDCNLAYLEGNFIELGRYLTMANLVAPLSDSDLSKVSLTDESSSVSKKISVVISDSLSLLYDMKRKSGNPVALNVKDCLQDVTASCSSILGCKKKFLEKLVSLQKQQIEFIQNLLDRVSEFDSGISVYHNTGENMKNEIRKLFSVLLTKENQIQKQCDEINNLKALLTSSDKSENATDEISILRKVVSNKDVQLIEKEELIHNLRSLNYTIRRTKLSKSSPSVCCTGDLGTNLEEKMQQLEDCMLNIKANLSSVLMYLKKNQDKLSIFEEESRCLVQVLAETHKGISSCKEGIIEGTGDFCKLGTSLDEHLNNAASKVEQLLSAMETFLCDREKMDLNFVSEVLRRKLMKLIFIAEFIKKCALQEHNLIKVMINENEDFKKKDVNKDELIKNLNDSLHNAQSEIQALQEDYTNLKIQKEDMELRNQKVMEELQTKICTLQETASLHQPSESESLLHLQKISEAQIEKLKQLENRETTLRHTLLKKEKELESNKKETKDLMNMLTILRTENIHLQSQVNDARTMILKLQQNLEAKKDENSNLKVQLEELGNLSSLQNMEVDKLHKELLSTTMKLDELKVSEALANENYRKLHGDYQTLLEERASLENNILSLNEELNKITDEVAHRHHVAEKQKENLTKYLEENQALKIQQEENEKVRVKLEYDLVKLQEDLKEIQDREFLTAGELVEKNQAIFQLNLEKLKLESYIHDLETSLKEKKTANSTPQEKGDTNMNVLEEQEATIDYLKMCLHQMRQYIAERDETIELIEAQLKASTELMLEETDIEDKYLLNSNNEQNTILHCVSSYKSKLQQAMQQNWHKSFIHFKLLQIPLLKMNINSGRNLLCGSISCSQNILKRRLVNLVNKLQTINFSLINDEVKNMNVPGVGIGNDAG